MSTYVIVMVEPKKFVKKEEQEGVDRFFPLHAAFPSSETCVGVFTPEQLEAGIGAVEKWYNNPPDNISEDYKSMRKCQYEGTKSGDFYFAFQCNEDVEFDVLMDDTEKLRNILKEECEHLEMVTSRYTLC